MVTLPLNVANFAAIPSSNPATQAVQETAENITGFDKLPYIIGYGGLGIGLIIIGFTRI